MVTFSVSFLISTVVSMVLTVLVRNRALAWGLLDQVRSSRNVHQQPIPRLGGVAIVLGFFAPLTGLLLVDSGVGAQFLAQRDLVFGLFAGGTVIAALGLYDDLRGAGAREKFTVQFLVAAALYALDIRIELIANPFGAPIELGALGFPITLLWVVGVINALNLIDGLDGLAGGVAFFGVATNFILAVTRGDVLMCLMMAALGGAILGFLIFNFNPASIFMGDTGSMFLGFVLAAVSIKTSTKSGTAVALLVPIVALGLPIMDTLLAMIRRTMLGRPVFSADKEHIHHRLMSRFFLSHRRAVLVLYGLCCLFMLTALSLAFANRAQSVIILGTVATVVVTLMRKLGYLDLGVAPRVVEIRRRNLELRTAVRDAAGRIRFAQTRDEIWLALRALGRPMKAAAIKLKLNRHVAEMDDAVLFEAVWVMNSTRPLDVRLVLENAGTTVGELVVTWRDGRIAIDRDDELALEVVAESLVEAQRHILEAEEYSAQRVIPLRR